MLFTRRQFSLQIASGVGLSGIAFAASQNSDQEISHTADAIHQEVKLSSFPTRESSRPGASWTGTQVFIQSPSLNSVSRVPGPGWCSITAPSRWASPKHLADGWKEHYWEPLQKYLQ